MTLETTPPDSGLPSVIAMAGLSFGDQLRAQRESLGLSYRDLAASTKIQGRLLQALEEEDLTEFDAPAYARGFLKLYARELGLDEDQVLASFPIEAPRKLEIEPAEPTTPMPIVSAAAPLETGSLATRPTPVTADLAEAARVRVAAVAGALALIAALTGAFFYFSTDSGEATAAAAISGDEELIDAWRPAPREYLDWQTVREN